MRRTLREILECGNARPFRRYYRWVASKVEQEARQGKFRKIAELGAGTALVTRLLAKEMRQGDLVALIPCDMYPDVAKLEAAGSLLTQAPGAPWTVCITPGPRQVLYTSDAYPGRIYKLTLEGKVLGVLGESGKQLKQFGWIHEIACPSENVLYVAELLNWRIQKLILHP